MPSVRSMFGPPLRTKVPPEFADQIALKSYLGLGEPELKKITYFNKRMYREFSIAKNPTKVRIIRAPNDRLKFFQRKIAEKLAVIYSPRNPVHGFVEDRSVKTNATSHLGRRHIVNLDIKDYFPSISAQRVRGMLVALNVDATVADIIATLCSVHGELPQGAPSSPILSNMICFRLDKALMAIAKETRCIYTRYADDITFSSHQPPTGLFSAALPAAGRFTPDLLAATITDAISQNGFVINPDKCHYADRNSRRIVTGVKVNELLNVDRRYVRDLRAAIYSIEKLGLGAAQDKLRDKYRSSADLARYLRGKIAYLSHIKGATDPVVRGITLRYNMCFPSAEIEVVPTVTEMRDRSVWVVDNDAAIEQGSAFFLKDIGLVSAEHCVTGATEVEVYHISKPANKFKARVKNTDARRDLAVLDHDIPLTEYFELELTPVACAIGDHVTAIGYPEFALGDGINVRSGTVTGFKVRSMVRQFEVSQTLSQGMSGGPMLNADNRIVGVIHRGGAKEERNFAVAIKELTDWLAE